MNKFLLFLILICHMLVILFVIIVPFSDNVFLLTLHVIVIPFIIFHWILNNNTCALTIMEHKIREHIANRPIPRTECFTSRLIEPIYDFKNNNQDLSLYIYIVTIGLWIISVIKLYNISKKINK